MPKQKQPLPNGDTSFCILKAILFTAGLLIIFIRGSLWATHLQSLHSGIFLLSFFVSALLSLQWSIVLKKGFLNWQAERYQHPGEFIKCTANELGSANAFKRMSVWKAAGYCIVLALKNETEILNSVKWTFCSVVESVCEGGRDYANGRMVKKIWTRTNLCKWSFSRDTLKDQGRGSRFLLDGKQFYKGRFCPLFLFQEKKMKLYMKQILLAYIDTHLSLCMGGPDGSWKPWLAPGFESLSWESSLCLI